MQAIVLAQPSFEQGLPDILLHVFLSMLSDWRPQMIFQVTDRYRSGLRNVVTINWKTLMILGPPERSILALVLNGNEGEGNC